MKFAIIICFAFIFINNVLSEDTDIEENSTGLYQIEGKVYAPDLGDNDNWISDTEISLNSGTFNFKILICYIVYNRSVYLIIGEYKGFLKSDGTFIISKVPSGSFVLEVLNPDYVWVKLIDFSII